MAPVAPAGFIAVAHPVRSERTIRELRTPGEKNGIEHDED